jgi:hypothetical protein
MESEPLFCTHVWYLSTHRVNHKAFLAPKDIITLGICNQNVKQLHKICICINLIFDSLNLTFYLSLCDYFLFKNTFLLPPNEWKYNMKTKVYCPGMDHLIYFISLQITHDIKVFFLCLTFLLSIIHINSLSLKCLAFWIFIPVYTCETTILIKMEHFQHPVSC